MARSYRSASNLKDAEQKQRDNCPNRERDYLRPISRPFVVVEHKYSHITNNNFPAKVAIEGSDNPIFMNFVGVNEKILNLNTVALTEDKSTAKKTAIAITTAEGLEIELEGTDAEIVLDRAELMIKSTDQVIAQLQAGSPA